MAKLITVGTFTSPLDAHLAKGRLEAEGVPAFVAHEHHIWANWMFSHALGGVKVQVIGNDVARAETILKAHMNGSYENDLKEEFPDLKVSVCPKCGSREFKNTTPLKSLLFVLLTLGLISIIFPLRRNNHVCLNCDNRWKD